MREWLARSYDDRSLDLRGGKIDRAAFQQHFGLAGGTFMCRYPKIRELFEGYDDRAAKEGYAPASWDEELCRLREALASEVPLDKTRLSVNRAALSQAIGIDICRLSLPRYSRLIQVKDETIAAAAAASRIDPFMHGRVFAFSGLATTWPQTFLERVGTRFKQVFASYAATSVKGHHLKLLDVLDWIGSADHPACVAVIDEVMRLGRVVSEDHWEEAIFAWRDRAVATIAKGKRDHGGVDLDIARVRMTISHLASAGLVPDLPDLPGIKRAARHVRHKNSLVELAPSVGSDSAIAEGARRLLTEAASRIGVETGREDEKFLETIRIDPGEDLPEAIRMLLQTRLEAVRERASAVMADARADFERGCALLHLATIDPIAFIATYQDPGLSAYDRRSLVHEFFPLPNSHKNVALGRSNLLSLIQAEHGGLPPPSAGRSGQFFGKRYNAYGGKSLFQRLLGVHKDAPAATLTLYLLESGANVSVGRTLDADCLETSDLPAHRRITGIKARAQGKPIVVDLPEDGEAVRALEWLRSRITPLKQRASPMAVDRLMLTASGSGLDVMDPSWFTGWFKKLASNLPCLAGIDVTPTMLRPSVLLHAALSNDGRLAVGMAIGQHGMGVTQGYQQKHPVRLLYDGHVRRFQSAFETLVLSVVPEAAARLGVDGGELAERLKALRPTGLGTFCASPAENGSPSCSSIDCWNECPHLAIVAEVEAIAAMRLWQTSLRACAGEWERDRPERWETCWLPWLCLVDAVEHRMSRGALLSIWERAGQRAHEIASDPGYVPAQPW